MRSRGHGAIRAAMPRVGLAVALALATAAPVAAENFAQALRTVAATHPRLQAVDAVAVAGRAEVDAARAGWRPQVSLVGDTGWQRSGLTSRSDTAFLPGVRASQLVYDGGRTNADVAQRRFRAEALAVEHDRVLADLAQRLADAYLEWTRQRALYAIADEQVVSLRKLETMVRAIADFDRGRASDVALVSTRLAQSEAARDARRVAIADARGLIRQIAAADVEPEGEMPAPEPFMPKSLDEALTALDAHPALRIADLEIAQAGAAVDAARAWWKPRLSLDAGSESESSLTGRTNLFGTVELKLRSALTPIDGGGGSARLASAQASASAARLEARFAQRDLRDEVTRHWISISERTPRLVSLAALVDTTDTSSAVVGEQFKLGRRSILDLLSFEVERFAARTQLESERRDVTAAKYRLLAVTARLGPAFVPDAVEAPAPAPGAGS